MLLETVSGKLIDVENPDPSTIEIDDIAWALSRIPRFAAHTITAVPYNVAQHSVFVANEVTSILKNEQLVTQILSPFYSAKETIAKTCANKISIQALIHDAAEAYIGDIPSPVKKIPELRPFIKKAEANLMSAIYKSLNIEPPTADEETIIKYADLIAQRVEAHAFMQSRGNNWPGLPEVTLERLQTFQSPKSSLISYKLFLQKYHQLKKNIGN